MTGVGLGAAAAFGVTRVLTSLLFDVAPTDLWTFTAAVAVLLVAAVVGACGNGLRRPLDRSGRLPC